MKYGIEYHALFIMDRVWHSLPERYSTEEEAQSAIETLLARGGKWARRGYRVSKMPPSEPTHPELVRLVERLRTADAVFAFWSDDDAEALLLGDDHVMIAVPGAPLWEGLRGDRQIGAIVSEIRERVRVDRERADRERAERADRAQWEREQQEGADRERADRERADEERADRERADRAQWELERQGRATRERADRERADQERADCERADRAQWEKEQQERADRERADRAQWEKEQKERAERERAERAVWDRPERERTAWDHADDDRAERRHAPR